MKLVDVVLAAACSLLLCASPASAHVAFSSVELRVGTGAIDVTVVAQAYDLAHELGVDPPERLVDLAFLPTEREPLAALMNAALSIAADGEPLAAGTWAMPSAAPDQQLVRLRGSFALSRSPGRVTIVSRLFSYDTAHQTLVTIYEGDTLATQQVLDAQRAALDYFTGTRAGFWSIARRFSMAGLARAFTAYNHLLFLVALLLLGGTARQLAGITAAFLVSCSIALAAAASGVIPLPVFVIAPGVALSVVYAGVDNLMIRGGRDVRVWVALAFGSVHGVSFADALSALDRPVQRFAWAVAWFNSGVMMALLLTAVGVVALSSLFANAAPANRRGAFVTAVSVAVAALGAVSFIRQIAMR